MSVLGDFLIEFGLILINLLDDFGFVLMSLHLFERDCICLDEVRFVWMSWDG